MWWWRSATAADACTTPADAPAANPSPANACATNACTTDTSATAADACTTNADAPAANPSPANACATNACTTDTSATAADAPATNPSPANACATDACATNTSASGALHQRRLQQQRSYSVRQPAVVLVRLPAYVDGLGVRVVERLHDCGRLQWEGNTCQRQPPRLQLHLSR
jgi:hypothetical protein